MSSFLKICFAGLLTAAASATPAFAQATRTWISGVGDDANPCSRTAPCKTFAGAISKTAGGGEINCLDPGGFGAVTITKSITIDCTGTFGSILNSGSSGLTINDAATATPNSIEVVVRGVAINGAGSLAGQYGIRFLSGRSLALQDVLVQNQTGNTGIAITPAGAAEFYAEDVTVTDGAFGIVVQPTGSNGSVRAILRNVRAQNNSTTGLNVSAVGNGSVAGSIVVVDKSAFTGNASGIVANAPGTTQTTVFLNDSIVSGNSTLGLRAIGTAARIRVANSVITANQTGLVITSGGFINTYGNNRLDGNVTDGAFTAPALPEE